MLRRCTLLLILLLATGTAARAQCPSFAAPRALPMAGVTALADFDGDGRLDALSGHSIYVGLTRRVDVPDLDEMYFTRIEDLNGDGRPDIVTGNQTVLETLFNNSNLTFRAVKTPVSAPYRFDFADFNGDGILDVVLQQSSASTPILLGNRSGSFRAEEGLNLPKSMLFTAADVNGDHRADLIEWDGLEFRIHLRQDKGFGPAQMGAKKEGNPLFVADLNGDGREDLVLLDWGGSSVRIYYDPQNPAATPNLSLSEYPDVVDVNGDGALDLISPPGRFDQPRLTRILINDGHGNFRVSQTLPGTVRGNAAADIDGDGIVDLLVRNGTGAFVLPGNGDGTFRVPQIAFPKTRVAVAGDFDGDGNDDVVFPHGIAWNNGDGTFRVVNIDDPRLNAPLRAADVDGDGAAELIAAGDGQLFVLGIRRDGTIAETKRIAADLVPALGANGVAVGDFTGAHRRELAVLTSSHPQDRVGQSLTVFEIENATARYTTPIDGSARALIALDANGDGRDDIVIAGGERDASISTGGRDGFVQTLLSTGASFQPPVRFDFAFAAFDALAGGDFDGDGHADVAVLQAFVPIFATIFRGDGTGTFKRDQVVPDATNDNAHQLMAGDFDGDGRTDLAINGATAVLYGRPGDMTVVSYFGPQDYDSVLSYAPLLLRLYKHDELPSLLVPTAAGDGAFVYRAGCLRRRPVRR